MWVYAAYIRVWYPKSVLIVCKFFFVLLVRLVRLVQAHRRCGSSSESVEEGVEKYVAPVDVARDSLFPDECEALAHELGVAELSVVYELGYPA